LHVRFLKCPNLLLTMNHSVVVATGLIALVDNCIKDKWQTKKAHRIPVPLTPKALKSTMLHRSHSDHHGSSPLRYVNPIPAY